MLNMLIAYHLNSSTIYPLTRSIDNPTNNKKPNAQSICQNVIWVEYFAR